MRRHIEGVHKNPGAKEGNDIMKTLPEGTQMIITQDGILKLPESMSGETVLVTDENGGSVLVSEVNGELVETEYVVEGHEGIKYTTGEQRYI